MSFLPSSEEQEDGFWPGFRCGIQNGGECGFTPQKCCVMKVEEVEGPGGASSLMEEGKKSPW